jgi:hypothetical protein
MRYYFDGLENYAYFRKLRNTDVNVNKEEKTDGIICSPSALFVRRNEGYFVHKSLSYEADGIKFSKLNLNTFLNLLARPFSVTAFAL